MRNCGRRFSPPPAVFRSGVLEPSGGGEVIKPGWPNRPAGSTMPQHELQRESPERRGGLPPDAKLSEGQDVEVTPVGKPPADEFTDTLVRIPKRSPASGETWQSSMVISSIGRRSAEGCSRRHVPDAATHTPRRLVTLSCVKTAF
jgi:hypothetical protein